VVIGTRGATYHVLGALCHAAQGSGGFLDDARWNDSNDMEIAAVIWALTWVLASGLTCPVSLGSDSLFALNTAQSHWDPGSHSDVAEFAAAFLLTMTRQATDIKCNYIRARDGHQWNELADGLAKRAARGTSCRLPPHLCRVLSRDSGLRWEWLRSADDGWYQSRLSRFTGATLPLCYGDGGEHITPPCGGQAGLSKISVEWRCCVHGRIVQRLLHERWA